MPQPTELPPEPKITQRDRELAAFSYMWAFSIIVLFLKNKSDFVRLHARQGTILFLLSLILWPWPYLRYGEIVILGLAIMGFVEAFLGHPYTLPLIGQMVGGEFHWGKVKNILKKESASAPPPPPPPRQACLPDRQDLEERLQKDEQKITRLEEEVRHLEDRIGQGEPEARASRHI